MLKLEVLSERDHRTVFAAEILELKKCAFLEHSIHDLLYQGLLSSAQTQKPRPALQPSQQCLHGSHQSRCRCRCRDGYMGREPGPKQGAQRSKHVASAARQECILGPKLKG